MSHFHRDSILVPIDFSEASMRAVRVARTIAESDSEVTVVHVGPNYDLIAPAPAWGMGVTPIYDLEGQRNRLQSWIAEHDLGDVKLEVQLGDPGDEVCRLAEELKSKLIVVPSHGRHGLERVLLGSVAERIIRHCACSVLVLRRGQEDVSASAVIENWCPRNRVLVPIDFSPSSESALQVAKELVDDRANIDVLNTLQSLDEAILVGSTVPTHDELRANRQEYLERYLAEHGHSGMRAHVIVGDPGLSIASYAQTSNADLVVMPSHGYHGLHRLVLGSTTERVLRHCHSPVLVLRRHDAE